MLAVVVIIVAIIGYRKFTQSRDRTARNLRKSVQSREQADLPGDRVSQREERRLAGMTVEDRTWEQASLGRDRDSPPGRARRTPVADDTR